MTAPDARLPRLDELPAERSERGRLQAPDLDDRRWQDIVDEAKVLIERYAPQWTDRNPSDIGMTLIELFAWLVESLIYRLNRVPEKHYVALLDLLGIGRAPMVPARTLLTFTPTTRAVTVAAGTAAQTAGTEEKPPIVFETDTAITVAVRTAGIVRVDDREDAQLPAEERHGVPAGSLAASLAPGRGVQACLAIDPVDPPLHGIDLYVEPFRPPRDRQAVERIEWVFSVTAPPDPDDPRSAMWAGTGPWRALDVVEDGTAGLVRPGIVRLRVPAGADWTPQDPQAWSPPRALAREGVHHWLGVRVTNASAREGARLALWLDRLLPNTTTATSVGTATREKLGVGTGKPGQVVRLARWPLFARPDTDTPYDHVRITVGGTAWQAVESLPDGPGQCYLLDPVAGEITFGDGDQASGRGSAPGTGQPIMAERYRYVSAGAAANVPAETVQVVSGAVGSPPPVVSNPVPGFGGTDEEPIEEAKRRAPEVLRHRGRAVTADDYEHIARGAAPGIAMVRCLPPRLYRSGDQGGTPDEPWTYGNLQRAPGVVNVVVVPDLGPDVPEPVPSLALVQDVIRALDRRRPVGTALHVDGPRYVRVGVRAGVSVFPSAIDQGLVMNEQAVYDDTKSRVLAFLHPVHGRGGAGWRIGQSISISDLYQVARPAEDVGFITSLTLVPEELVYVTSGDPENQRPLPDTIGQETSHVRIADYELICAGGIDVGPSDEGRA